MPEDRTMTARGAHDINPVVEEQHLAAIADQGEAGSQFMRKRPLPEALASAIPHTEELSLRLAKGIVRRIASRREHEDLRPVW